ncbi:metallophosphoesterase [Cronbergia sp. UHCC 0137]|uniref:metallophosphoesterase family protein n=1 Tax=Cronbergia sp. UHCC 0137 TaxID=3110239 RepID=UPI002B218DFB|nr:metallophosphoesterase [Cronbergia sp. UHCC 0137]MEA5617292.1 metallophosphoesterase [Cronbergia sp. UHCC 0137]
MSLITEPSVPAKIQKMKERVRWKHPSIRQRGIDQTCLVVDDNREESPEFSFMVIGDSGTKTQNGQHPQRQVAELMLKYGGGSRFVLHTGDVIYIVGSREYYQTNFIEPYREFLVGGENPAKIAYDRMVFNLPIFPVLGNHDYYDVPLLYRLLSSFSLPLRRLLGYENIEIGRFSSNQGDAYARAFLDYLAAISPAELERHLDQHYTAKSDTGRCLRYQPGKFTRLPNRYYTFRYGGIDFFALDSNTFKSSFPNSQGNENILNIDFEQLNWLQNRLIESWHTSQVRGRIIFFHHPPYVTEANKWYQSETLAVRHSLRWVFEKVAQTLGNLTQQRPIVDLILSGHAHCLEYLRTVNTGYADSHINCIISGGSGHFPRPQRQEGSELMETFRDKSGSYQRKVADSLLFVGRSGAGMGERLPYSCVRIDVLDGTPPQFIIKPLITEQIEGEWCDRQLDPFVI